MHRWSITCLLLHFNQHEALFRQILLHKKLSILEQSSYAMLELVETENMDKGTLNLLKHKPAIICTFHLGSYRMINLFLAKHKIPFCLVMGKEVVEKEGRAFASLFKELPGNNASDALPIINAEAPGSGLQMLRELKKGRSLVLYMDGNTGAGTVTAQNDNRCIIDFLHQQLFARKGISFLAHAAKVPIVPVACYRKSWDAIRLHFFDPIYPAVQQERHVFAAETTQRIYDLVTPLLKAYPEQWEAWLYLHKVAKISGSPNQELRYGKANTVSGRIIFNPALFGIFKINAVPFLLKKCGYSFYEIDPSLYDLLTTCQVKPLEKACFDKEIFNQLYDQQVLIDEKVDFDSSAPTNLT